MKHVLTESLGWYGVVAILGAYALLSFGVITADSLAYQSLNATGAVGIVADAWAQKNWQPAVLNIVWFAIAAIAILRLLLG
jgi:hypothetical protein